MQPPRVPPSFFGISFGLAGLGEVWRTAATQLDVPFVVADAIFIGAAAVWAILLAGYLSQGPRQVLADFSDTALGPFISLAGQLAKRAASSAIRLGRCSWRIRPARSSWLMPCSALQSSSVAVPSSSAPSAAPSALNPERSSVSASSCAKRASIGSWNIAS